jgi:dipeptidyl aminopeptidase/acylaminoacyl peptidase
MRASTSPRGKKRPIKDTDLLALNIVTSISLSTDEKRIAYTVERIDAEKNRYYSNLFIYDLSRKSALQYTHGYHSDGGAVWSPDGKQLAFISTRDKRTGIYVMSADGGPEKMLIEVEADISELNWTPNGKELVFGLRYRDSYFIPDEKKKSEAPVYRHITRLFYRLDGYGFLPKDTWQVYALNITTMRLRKITKGKRDNNSPVVSPDGKLIAFLSNRAKDPDLDPLKDDIFVISINGGRERRVPTPAGPKTTLRFSPDSKTIAYIGHDNPRDAWGVTNLHIWTVGVSGNPKAKNLIPKFDRMACDQSLADMEDAHDKLLLQWSADGKRLFFISSDTGNTNMYYVPRSGGKPTRIFKGSCHVKNFSVNGSTKIAALVYADFETPNEILVCPTQFGGEQKAIKLTDLNPMLRDNLKLGKTREIMFDSFDGTKVQGFLLTPPDFSPSKKYPSILEIHGGPRTQYAFTFFHEMQMLAASGYVVFYTNPRGGSGRGETWADAIAGGWGDLDYKDCMAAADWLEKQKYIDKNRMGVTGGSYGGYMTNWIIGHTNRFKAAVTQRSVVELKAFFGSSDLGWTLEREFNGFPWTNPSNYEKCSPLTYSKKVKTPVLILHNEKDLRCSIEQAEQMFTMLKVLGKKVEFVRFPDEPHGLSRHGRPDRRLARLNWILKWMNTYLKK